MMHIPSKLTLNKAIKDLYFCGDIHGNLQYVGYVIKSRNLTNCCIFLCGDVGLGFNESSEREIIARLDVICKERNIFIIAVRGNHDDPKYWENSVYDKRFFTLPDYTIVSTEHNNVMCIGGAVSVDRVYRLENKLGYWPNEVIKKDYDIINELDTKIDIIVSHSSPLEAYPYGSNSFLESFFYVDGALEADILKEREYLSWIFKTLTVNKHPLTNWIYGHYHSSNTTMCNNTTFKLLGCEEIFMLNDDKS